MCVVNLFYIYIYMHISHLKSHLHPFITQVTSLYISHCSVAFQSGTRELRRCHAPCSRTLIQGNADLSLEVAAGVSQPMPMPVMGKSMDDLWMIYDIYG